MKAIFDAKSFVEAVNWATKSYDSKNDKAHVALFVDGDGTAYLSHSNLNSYMKSEINVVSVDFTGDKVDEASFAMEGKYVQRLASAISTTGQIAFSKKLSDAKTSLAVKTSAGNFTVPLLDSKIPDAPETVSLGEVDDKEFFDSMIRIAKLCDPANAGSNTFIGAVDLGFDTKNETVSLFATDRYAMGEVVLGFSPDEDDDEETESFIKDHILLPHASAVLVQPTKGVDSSITLIGEEGNSGNLRFGYSFPDGRVALFSLMNAERFEFLDNMKKKVSESVENSISVPTSELAGAIRVISSLAWEEDDVYFTISKDGLVVSDGNNTNKVNVAHTEIDYDLDEEYRARFVRSVINEAFSPISTGTVKLKWGSSSTAFVLAPVTDDGQELETVFVMAVLGRNR